MRILFLDDDKARHRKFRESTIGCDVTFVFTYEAAVAALEAHVFDEAHLDHDLSELAAAGLPTKDEKTGTDLANYIAAMPRERWPGRIVVHSLNLDGSPRMVRILRSAGHPRTVAIPFGEGRNVA